MLTMRIQGRSSKFRELLSGALQGAFNTIMGRLARRPKGAREISYFTLDKAEPFKWRDATRLASDSRFTWLAHKATGFGCVLCNKAGVLDPHSLYASFQVSDGRKRICM